MTYYDLNMNNKRINNTQDPSGAQDVATKNYVDTKAVVLSSWTTATRPNPPVNYTLGYNTTLSQIDFYNGTTWAQLSPLTYIDATGGTITTYTSGATNYRVHTFTSTGTFVINALSSNNVYNAIDYVVVAGGGGNGGGAGGAGGFLTATGYSITATGNYAVVVGLGGAGNATGQTGSPGQNSSLSNPTPTAIATAIGGGGGGTTYSGGQSGGSGGGGGSSNGGQGYGSGGAGTAGQGFAGGGSGFDGGGGGGGAGGVGSGNGPTPPASTGNGGAGIQNAIQTGSNQYYSAGGGAYFVPTQGQNGTGWASGGYGHGGSYVGQPAFVNGRPGVVIIRYVIA